MERILKKMSEQRRNGSSWGFIVIMLLVSFLAGCCVSQKKAKATKGKMLTLRKLYERDRRPVEGEVGHSTKPIHKNSRKAFLNLVKAVYEAFGTDGEQMPAIETKKEEPKAIEAPVKKEEPVKKEGVK